PTLDLLRRAADKPVCRFVRDWSRPSISLMLPEMQNLRQAARLLALAARREAADGDHAAAIRDTIRIHRIGRHAAAEPILVCGLVGLATDTLALQTLADILPRLEPANRPLLDDTGLTDFVGSPIRFDKHFLGEEAFGLATIADLADGRQDTSILALMNAANGSGSSVPFVAEPLSQLFRCFLLPADMASYRKQMAGYQQVAALQESDRSYPEIQKRSAAFEDPDLRRAGIFTSLMTPALSNVLKTEVRSRALHRAAEVLVAATRARLATGPLPDTAAAFAPNFLPALPRDPFTVDQPLLLKRADGTWTVYSVGPDGEDDGGPLPAGADAVAGNDDVGLRMAL
ncbi:MAG: hypothetical protein RLZZ111_258, partial [Planctomycetota bacterium]